MIDVRITEVRAHSLRGEPVACLSGASTGAPPQRAVAKADPPQRQGAGDDHRGVGGHPAVAAEDHQAERPAPPRTAALAQHAEAPPADAGELAAPEQLGQRRRRCSRRRRAGAKKLSRCQKASSGPKRAPEPSRYARLDERANFIIARMSVFALGLNHTTAPLDLRGRFAFAPEQLRADPAGASAPRRDRASEVAIVSTCNRTELYVGAERRQLVRPGRRLAGRRRRRAAARRCATHAYVLEGALGGAPRLPRRQRARFDGARRAADPRPDEAGGARGRRGRHARHHAAPDVPALVRGRQGSAQLDRDRRPLDQHGGRGGAPGVAAVRGPARDPGAVRRRRRDDRAGRDALRGAQAARAWRWPTARSSAARSWPRASAPRRCALADLPAAPGRVRHRHLLHRELAADHRPGRGRARAEGAPAPADVHGRPGRAARHRARGGAPGRRLPLHRRRPVGAGADRRREAPGRGRAGRGDHRGRRAELRALARPARHGAADPGAARAGRRLARARDRARAQAAGRAARTSTRCSRRCRAA